MNHVKAKILRGIVQMNDELRSLLHGKSGEYLITIDKLPLKRSQAQNKYYWAVIVPMYRTLWAEVKGRFSKEIVSGILKKKFLTKEVVCEYTGEVFTIIQDTSSLTVEEFDDYIQHCRYYYLSETGEEIYLPKDYQ